MARGIPDLDPRPTCLNLLEETKVLTQQGGEQLLSDPLVDPGLDERKGASAAASGQAAVGQEERGGGGSRQ